jgi:hypothetical protein
MSVWIFPFVLVSSVIPRDSSERKPYLMTKIFPLVLSLVCVALTLAAQDKVDVTGAWVFQVETSAGSGSPSFTFKQEGEKLTGKYSGQLGNADISGTVKGNQIEFSFTVDVGKVTYTGTIEGGTMKGKVELGDQASGTWTAKRKE